MTDERQNLPSASGLERLALCPGSWAAEQASPTPDTSTPEADSGTAIHAVLAGEPPARPLTTEEENIATACARLAKEVAVATYGAFEHADTLIREQRLWLRVDGTSLLSGKPDLIAIYGMRALILDYKTGRGEVEAAALNLQLRALVALVASNYPIKEATVVIVQPFSVAGTSSACYNEDDIEAARINVLDILSQSYSAGARRIPSEKACKYCRAKAICPEAREQSLALAESVPAAITQPEMAALVLSDDELSTFLDRAAFAEKVIDACRDEAKRRLANGVELHGWKLKPGVDRETIVNPQTVYDRFTDIGGNGEQFLECVSITKGKLKDAVKAITTARGKALDAAMTSMLDGCVETKTSSPSLIKA